MTGGGGFAGVHLGCRPIFGSGLRQILPAGSGLRSFSSRFARGNAGCPYKRPTGKTVGSSRPKSSSFRAASDNSASGSAGAGSGQGAAGAEACGVDGWAWEHEAGWAWPAGPGFRIGPFLARLSASGLAFRGSAKWGFVQLYFLLHLRWKRAQVRRGKETGCTKTNDCSSGQHCLHSRGTGGSGQQFQAPLAAESDGIQDRHTI